MNISPNRFETLVFTAAEEVLAQLSPELRADAEEVILQVADRATPEQLQAVAARGDILLGLYEGVPLIHRRPASLLFQPDRITLFRLPMAAMCRTEIALKAQIRHTLIHELGHFFGFTEAELEDRGWA